LVDDVIGSTIVDDVIGKFANHIHLVKMV